MTSGHVLWPDESNGYQDSGEGGLWAYVFFTAEPDEGKEHDFDDCSSPSGVIALPLQDVVSHDTGGIYDKYAGMDDPYPVYPRNPATGKARETLTRDEATQYAHKYNAYFTRHHWNGRQVLAAVCLGSTHESLYSDAVGEYFQVTQDTLTPTGQKLVLMLSDFYDRTPHFVTYLDT